MYHTSATFPQLLEESKGTCMIMIGCVEKHGLHLPLGTDTLVGSRIAYMASQIETVAVFPDYIFGDEPPAIPGHQNPGNVTLPVETHFLLLEQLCDQIYLNGFRKILIFNGHGGNSAWISAFMRNIDNKNKKYVVAKFTIDLQAPDNMARYLEENGSGSIPEINEEDEALLLRLHKQGIITGHACFGEGVTVMAIAPNSVRLDLMGKENGLPTGESRKYLSVGLEVKSSGWYLEFPNAYSATDVPEINERIGAAALRMEAERLARAIKVFKEDEKLLKMIDNTQGEK